MSANEITIIGFQIARVTPESHREAFYHALVLRCFRINPDYLEEMTDRTVLKKTRIEISLKNFRMHEALGDDIHVLLKNKLIERELIESYDGLALNDKPKYEPAPKPILITKLTIKSLTEEVIGCLQYFQRVGDNI